MDENKPFANLKRFAAVALFVTVAGTGIALWTGHQLAQRSPSNESSTSPQEIAKPGQPQVYWLATTPDQPTTPSEAPPSEIAFSPRNITAPTGQSPDNELKAAFIVLLSSTAPANANTAIPPNTRLLSVTQTPQGVTVDLSQEFTEGGGSSSMIARLGQVIYTASSLDPNQPIWLRVEGAPLTVLGGEGLMIDQPLTRAQFEAEFLQPN